MELVFQEKRMVFPSCVLRQCVSQEQTADLIVPDRLPDCERVLEGFGTVTVRSAEAGADSASVVGTVQAGVLFADADGVPHSLQTQLPFSVRRELTPSDGALTLQCSVRLTAIDARMLNSRKLLVRATVLCCIEVFSAAEKCLYDIEEPSERLQLRRVELPARMALALGEKRFPVQEELELPEEYPAAAEVLKWTALPEITEQKIVGAKAVFKGCLRIHVLYADAEQTLRVYDWTLPFSQYAELERDCEDCRPEALVWLTAFELEPESHGESRRLFLNAGVAVQCRAIGEERLHLITDAFCTDAELEPRMQEWTLDTQLDRQSFSLTAQASGECAAGKLVDVSTLPGETHPRREGGSVVLEVPLSCSVLYQDAEGRLQSTLLRTSVSAETAAAGNVDCAVAELRCGEAFCTAAAGALELRLPIALEVSATAQERLQLVCGGTVSELPPQEQRKPAVILRRTIGDEEVWSVAKGLRASVEAITRANAIDGDVIPDGTMLLIPI